MIIVLSCFVDNKVGEARKKSKGKNHIKSWDFSGGILE
jgi:hypothetical protein